MDVYKKLINEVKKHEILYERSHEEYHNEEKKNLVWEEIGLSTNTTGERAKKKWENIHNAYLSSKTISGGNTNKFAPLLAFLEADGNRTFCTSNEGNASFVEGPKEMSYVEQTSTPKSKKRKRELEKVDAAEAELSLIDACNSPLNDTSTTSVACGRDDIDHFCHLVGTRMRLLPQEHLRKSKRQILEILHRCEIDSL